MKNFIFTLILLFNFSCKSIEINGIAINSKDGAVILSDEQIYYVENYNVWSDTVHNKKIKAIVKVKKEQNITKYDLMENDDMNQGRIGKTITVKIIDFKIDKN